MGLRDYGLGSIYRSSFQGSAEGSFKGACKGSIAIYASGFEGKG